MTTRPWLFSAPLTFALACSAKGPGGFPQPSNGSTPAIETGDPDAGLGTSDPASGDTSTNDDSAGSSGGGLGTSSGGDRSPLLGDASVPEDQLDPPVTLTMDPFTVAPNSEVFMCQQFGNPFGHDVDLAKIGYTPELLEQTWQHLECGLVVTQRSIGRQRAHLQFRRLAEVVEGEVERATGAARPERRLAHSRSAGLQRSGSSCACSRAQLKWCFAEASRIGKLSSPAAAKRRAPGRFAAGRLRALQSSQNQSTVL